MWMQSTKIMTVPVYTRIHSTGWNSVKQIAVYITHKIMNSLKYSKLLSRFDSRGRVSPTIIMAKIEQKINPEI
jgi:hypothetical protein